MSRSNWRARALFTIVALSCLAACGGDDDSSTNRRTTGASGSPSGGASAAGSSAQAPASVPCGAKTCAQPDNPVSALLGGGTSGSMGLPGLSLPGLGMAVACCLDKSAGLCGVAPSADATCEPPPVADPRCPSLGLGGAIAGFAPAGGLPGLGSGCCIKNACGQDGALFGHGCVENNALKEMLSGSPFGTFLMVPESRACDAPPPPDAGVDAGS